MRKIIKYTTVMGVTGAIIAIGLYFLLSKNGQSTETKPGAPRDVYTVSRGDISRTVQLVGKVQSLLSENVVSSVNARIKEVFVKDGDYVEKGQILILLNENDLKNKLEEARSKYINAKTSLEELRKWECSPAYVSANTKVETSKADCADKEKTLLENIELYEAKAISRNDLDRSKRDLQRSKLDLEAAIAQFEETKSKGNKSAKQMAQSNFICAEIDFRDAQAAMEHVKIVAPCTGIVSIEKQSSPTGGEAVKAVSENRTVSPGDILMTVDERSRLAVGVQLNEYDVYSIREGQDCSISAPALPGQRFTGKVVSISPKSSNRDDTSFQMVAQIDQLNAPLKFGMTAYVQLLLQEKTNVLFVPTSALVSNNMQTGVYLPGKVEPEFIPVHVGVRNYDVAEILNGLSEGQQILCRVPASLFASGESANMMGGRPTPRSFGGPPAGPPSRSPGMAPMAQAGRPSPAGKPGAPPTANKPSVSVKSTPPPNK